MLKKIMLGALLIGSVCGVASAQYTNSQNNEQSEIDQLRQEVNELKSAQEEMEYKANQKRIWGYGRYKRISWVNQSLTQQGNSADVKWPCKYGFGLTIGNTYMLPMKPLFGVIKIGIDATWFDVTYVKYKDRVEVDETGGTGSYNPGSNSTDGVPGFNFPNTYPELDALDLANLGVHQLQIGMGIGPSINIAPFAFASRGLQPLKAQIYGHFIPSASAILYTDENDETCVSAAFVPQFSTGLSVNYKQFGIGIEGRWGSAKYNNLVSTDDFIEDENGNEIQVDGKKKFKNAAFRVYLNFHF